MLDAVVNTFLYFRLGGPIDHQRILHIPHPHAVLQKSPSATVIMDVKDLPPPINLISASAKTDDSDSSDAPGKAEGVCSSTLIEDGDDSKPRTVRLVAISDTHERHEGISLPPCDIFVHCGDIFMTNRMLSSRGSRRKLRDFNTWLGTVPAKNRIVIAGNHDLVLETLGRERVQAILTNAIYLENSGVMVCGLRIFGSPASRGRSDNSAFQSVEFLEEAKREAVAYSSSSSSSSTITPTSSFANAGDADLILVGDAAAGGSSSSSSSKEEGVGACVNDTTTWGEGGGGGEGGVKRGGVDVLVTHGSNASLAQLLKPRMLHVWGHAHMQYGVYAERGWVSVCSSTMNHKYVPAHPPVVVDLPVGGGTDWQTKSESGDEQIGCVGGVDTDGGGGDGGGGGGGGGGREGSDDSDSD